MARRILLVDDEPRNLSLLEGFLRPLGHELVRATDGREALAAFERERPDLVLLDLVMPGFDGLDVLTHIRASEAGAHVPIVLVTAHTDREHRLRGLEAGADEFLEKPVDSAILLARVRTLLALKESRDALEASRDELARRHEALQQSQREVQELMAFVVHDLRNPLAIVCAGLDWTREELLPSQGELQGVVDEARDAATRLCVMIDDLLAIARMEQGALSLRREPLALAEVIERVAQPYARVAAVKGVALQLPAASALRVQADRALLGRVVQNLLDNALRYTPRNGRIAIGVRPCEGVEITVSNDGAPIAAGDRARIFEKFRRGSGEDAGLGNAGLGLYFCKRAVEAHGGEIGVVPTPGWATTFVVRLPSAGPS